MLNALSDGFKLITNMKIRKTIPKDASAPAEKQTHRTITNNASPSIESPSQQIQSINPPKYQEVAAAIAAAIATYIKSAKPLPQQIIQDDSQTTIPVLDNNPISEQIEQANTQESTLAIDYAAIASAVALALQSYESIQKTGEDMLKSETVIEQQPLDNVSVPVTSAISTVAQQDSSILNSSVPVAIASTSQLQPIKDDNTESIATATAIAASIQEEPTKQPDTIASTSQLQPIKDDNTESIATATAIAASIQEEPTKQPETASTSQLQPIKDDNTESIATATAIAASIQEEPTKQPETASTSQRQRSISDSSSSSETDRSSLSSHSTIEHNLVTVTSADPEDALIVYNDLVYKIDTSDKSNTQFIEIRPDIDTDTNTETALKKTILKLENRKIYYKTDDDNSTTWKPINMKDYQKYKNNIVESGILKALEELNKIHVVPRIGRGTSERS
jgi:hypothetical protein